MAAARLFTLGARLAYFERYGFSAAINNEGAPLLTADRRLDDVLPLDNASLILLGGYKKGLFGSSILPVKNRRENKKNLPQRGSF